MNYDQMHPKLYQHYHCMDSMNEIVIDFVHLKVNKILDDVDHQLFSVVVEFDFDDNNKIYNELLVMMMYEYYDVYDIIVLLHD